LLSAVAREIFNQNIDIVFVSSNREFVGQGRDQEHVIFHVSIPHNTETKMSSIDIADNTRTALSPAQKQDIIFQPVTLNKEQFATAFPYHLIFDEELRLLQYGKSVARLSPVRLREGIPVNTAFAITYPRIAFTVENVRRFINAIFILTVVPRVAREGQQQNQFSMK
ncbi:guanylate cyclase soluble subunit beta-2, partial [Biomphalaria pfeifferi]